MSLSLALSIVCPGPREGVPVSNASVLRRLALSPSELPTPPPPGYFSFSSPVCVHLAPTCLARLRAPRVSSGVRCTRLPTRRTASPRPCPPVFSPPARSTCWCAAGGAWSDPTGHWMVRFDATVYGADEACVPTRAIFSFVFNRSTHCYSPMLFGFVICLPTPRLPAYEIMGYEVFTLTQLVGLLTHEPISSFCPIAGHANDVQALCLASPGR